MSTLIIRVLRRNGTGTMRRVWEQGKDKVPKAYANIVTIGESDFSRFDVIQIYISHHTYNHIVANNKFTGPMRMMTAITNKLSTTYQKKIRLEVLLPEKALEHPPLLNLKPNRAMAYTMRFYFRGSPIVKYDRTIMGLDSCMNVVRIGNNSFRTHLLQHIDIVPSNIALFNSMKQKQMLEVDVSITCKHTDATLIRNAHTSLMTKTLATNNEDLLKAVARSITEEI